MFKRILTLVAAFITMSSIMMADNVLAISNLESGKGAQVVLPVVMNNTNQITAMSFELHLPAGVAVAKNANNKYIVTHTEERKEDQTVSSNLSDGVYYVATLSITSSPYKGNSGAVINITLDVAADAALGDKTIQIKNIVLSTPTTQKIKPANISCTLSVVDFRLGDANGDGLINVGDITTVASHILGQPTTKFVASAADVNKDGSINVGDITGIASMILSGE